MIYITGDIHGEVFRIAEAVARFNIDSEDVIVLLGDVGMNYYGNKRGDRHRKKRLNKLGVPMFCIHGNHEMRPGTIPSYHEVEWHGGAVYVEDDHPNLLFAKDGEVYDLNGQKTIVIGGAYSVDKWYRLQCDLNWFPDEQPSEEIKAKVEQKLHELGWRVDAVLTHTCPERYIPREAFLSGVDQATVDSSTEQWLDTIAERLDYRAWFCGHWHINKRIDKMHFLFDGFELLE
jgi:3-oxoacid CoA-transferase subunit A